VAGEWVNIAREKENKKQKNGGLVLMFEKNSEKQSKKRS